MARTVNFDTLAYANKLKQAGVPDKQAEAQSEALAEIFDYQAATKKDLQDLETRLSTKIDGKISEVEIKISQLEIKISEIKTEIIKWVVGLFFAQSALMISFLKFFH
jgi:septal ring factor EnvC (AmiA/AmiB activator)